MTWVTALDGELFQLLTQCHGHCYAAYVRRPRGESGVMINDDSSRSQAGRGRLAGARIDHWSLRFADTALEHEFERHRMRQGVHEIRVWAVFAILGYCLFGLLEWYLAPENLQLSLLVRYAIPLPFFLFSLAIAFTAYYEKYLVLMLALSVLCAGVSTIVMFCISAYPHNIIYPVFMVIVSLYLHGHMGIRFFRALGVSWSLVIGFVVAVAIINPPPDPAAQAITIAAVVLANIMVVFTSYNFEIFVRRDFRYSRILSMQLDATEISNQRALQAEHRLIDAIESISDGFALYDREDRLVMFNKRWLSVNDEMRDVVAPGMAFAEIVDRVAASGLIPEARGREAEWIAARTERHRNASGATERQTKGGRTYLVKERGTSDGGVVGVWSDVTEMEELEDKFRQSQKMEAIGGLIGGVAHEFNNLLMVISGNLEMLDERVRGDELSATLLDRALKGANRGADLTARLLAFSRKQSLRPVVFDPNELAVDLADVLAPTLGETIKIDTKLADGVWPINADRGQLESAVLNLALNARDAMAESGSITIETANRVVHNGEANAGDDGIEPGRYAVVSVTDDGPGMSGEVAEHAFEPFFTTKEVGKGTGLGLSMVYGFTKQSGGHVELESALGHGTTIRMYLPASRQDGAIETVPSVMDPHKVEPSQSILVDEDDCRCV